MLIHLLLSFLAGVIAYLFASLVSESHRLCLAIGFIVGLLAYLGVLAL